VESSEDVKDVEEISLRVVELECRLSNAESFRGENESIEITHTSFQL
jgi:hypothetical protein